MSIARKWFRVDMETEEEESKASPEQSPEVSFNTYLCQKKEENCIPINHCYEAVSANIMKTKFCDKDKVCCKNKICHDEDEFETVEPRVEGFEKLFLSSTLFTLYFRLVCDRKPLEQQPPNSEGQHGVT